MDDDVQPPGTPLGADSEPMDIVYAIVHTPMARDVMACLDRGEPIDDLRSADEGKVDAAVGLLQTVGVVTGDPTSLVLTSRGRRLNDQFGRTNDPSQL